jgi:hypothetical protein
MYCDACGQLLQPNQAFCGGCGKRVLGAVIPMAQCHNRVQGHVNFLGIFWLAYAGLNSIGAVLINVANALYGYQLNMPPNMHALLSALCYSVLALSAVGVAAGIGLIRREMWARTLTLILAFIALFTNVPFGTALGIYTLWVLLPRESEQEYEAISAAHAA